MTSQCSVLLNEGTVVGVEDKLPNGDFYYAYKGIPYAEPPVGKRRFEVMHFNFIEKNLFSLTNNSD